MQKRLITALILAAYTTILIKVMVFKDIPTIRIGQLMLNFGGTDTGHAPNFVPFKTIVPYLFGYKGLIIAGVNLIGNVALLVPIGFLVMLIYPNMTWKQSLALAVAMGLCIETMQTVLRLGIFDIDDVILNALGVMIGYGTFVILAKWMREKKYMHTLVASIMVIAAAAYAFYVVYPWGQPVMNFRVGAGAGQNEEGSISQSGDLCGGTGGNGEVISIGSNTFTLKLNDNGEKGGGNLIVNLTDRATIETPTGYASVSDLKIGDRVTLVGDNHRDGTFTAEAVVVCNAPGPETQ